jgi:hypothetical protein
MARAARVGGGLALLAAAILTMICFASAALALPLPIRIDTGMTLKQEFGYRPGYPLNIPSFDPWNRPAIRSRSPSRDLTRNALRLNADGTWVASSLIAVVRRAYPTFQSTVNAGGYVSERVEFDAAGRAYTLLDIRLRGGGRRNVLLYSLDGCRSWQLVTLPFGGKRVVYDGHDGGTASLEQYAGWNMSSRPPLVAVWRPVSDWPGRRAARNELYVMAPTFAGRRLVLPAPTLVSDRFIGMTYGAGGASFAATSGSTSYIVWAEVADSGADGAPAPGTPTYVCAFDRDNGTTTAPVLVAQAAPANDDHDTPGIVLDGDGYLHVLTGAHNAQFLYAHSLAPLDASAWTAPEPVLGDGAVHTAGSTTGVSCQTYLSLACLPDDSLVIVYRQRRTGVDLDFGGASHDTLSLQRRSPDGVWSDAVPLVSSADRPGYVCYHQKLTVDRRGRLYLSLSYYNPALYPPKQRRANRFRYRMVLISKDGGASWDFATTLDFLEGMAPQD